MEDVEAEDNSETESEEFKYPYAKVIRKLLEIEFMKLIYYEKGDNFLTNYETEKIPGLFATLVVQLPADHIGGALVVSHNKQMNQTHKSKSKKSKYS